MQSYDMSLATKRIFESKISFFTLQTVREVLQIKTQSSLYKVVKRLIASGILIKVERNAYMISHYTGSEFGLAYTIYHPSYISFESALSYYGVLSQFPYEVTSATIRQTKSKQYSDKEYGYYHIQKGLYWGYVKQTNFLIAEKEKALLDQLYLVSKGLKKASLEEYDLSLIDPAKLKLYAKWYPQTRQFTRALRMLSTYIPL